MPKKKKKGICPTCGSENYSLEHRYCSDCGEGRIFI